MTDRYECPVCKTNDIRGYLTCRRLDCGQSIPNTVGYNESVSNRDTWFVVKCAIIAPALVAAAIIGIAWASSNACHGRWSGSRFEARWTWHGCQLKTEDGWIPESSYRRRR